MGKGCLGGSNPPWTPLLVCLMPRKKREVTACHSGQRPGIQKTQSFEITRGSRFRGNAEGTTSLPRPDKYGPAITMEMRRVG